MTISTHNIRRTIRSLDQATSAIVLSRYSCPFIAIRSPADA